MAKLFGVIPYGGDSVAGQFVKDVGYAGEGFMGSAVAASQDMDEREANIADMVTKATLSSALELDSKYPAFVNAEQDRLNKYKLLRDDPAIGPEKAKYFFYAPGFLEQENWLTEAHKWSRSNPKYTKFYGEEEPEETYKENISKFQNTVKGQLSGTMGENMTNLFVGKDQSLEQPDIGQKTDTSISAISDTTQETGTEERVGMMPPMPPEGKSESIDRIWGTVLGYASQGIQPEQLLSNKIISKPEYDIWMSTSGSGDLRLESMKMAIDNNADLMIALLGEDPDAAANAFRQIQAMTNILYQSQTSTLTNVNLAGGGAPETINNITYMPTGTKTPDTKEKVYGVKTGEGTEYYVKRGNPPVYLKVIKHENGKTIVEGDKDSNKDTNFWGLPKGQYPLL
jgi:hypothetical protein